MDPLSQIVALLRPSALLWKQSEAFGRWAVRFPANRSVVFCLVAEGGCVFQAAGRPSETLRAGDFLLMHAPSVWTLGDRVDTAAIDFRPAENGVDAQVQRVGDRADGPVTRLFGGRFVFDKANALLLDGLLPPVVRISPGEDGASRLRSLLGLIGEEALAHRPGRALTLERLLELLFIEAIRHEAAAADVERQGLIAGLSDPRIAAALRAVHGDVRRGWTVADLARIAALSRSSFSDRFSRTVGIAPIDYLLRWRMALAKDRLRHGGERLAEIAQSCGYQSVSAFSVAFTRTVGCPPSAFRTEPEGLT